MNLNDLYEGREPYQQAIDKLEARRIEDLEMKMDDLARRAKEATDPKVIAALRHDFAKAKAERDSYHTVNEAPGAETLSHNQSTVADNENALDLEENNTDRLKVSPHDAGAFAALKGKPYESNPHPKGSTEYLLWSKGHNAMRAHKAELEEHGGGGGGPAQWHAYVKAHRTNEDEIDEHGGGVNGMKNYISWRKKANTERGVTKSAPPVGKSAPSSLPTIPKGTVHGKLDQSKGVVPKAAFEEGYVADTNYKYIVMVNGEEEGEYSSAEEAKDVVRTMRTRGPANNFSIKRKTLTSTRSIKKFQRSHSIDEAKADPTGSWVVYKDGSVKKFKTHGGAKAYAEKNGGKVASNEFYADKIQKQKVEEGSQDFNKKEPYEVCLAGKPVKTFDYYQDARRFHDNWKKKLYNQGEKEKADKITLNPIMKEETMAQAAHNPSGAKFGGYYKGTQVGAPRPGQSFGAESIQQEGAKVDRMQKHIAKSEKDLGHSKKDAESIAWATLNKRGYLDNVNKKEHTEEGIEGNMTVRSMPLMQPLKKRNPVAKNAIQSGAGKHANNLKKAVAQGRKAKHKAQAIPFDESAQPNFLSWVMEQAEFAGFDKNPAIYESAKQAFAEAKISEIKKGQKDSNGNSSCWTGYHAAGTKKGKNGGQVRNCVKNENVNEADPNAPYTPSPAKPFRNPKGFNKQGTGVGNKLAQQTRAELAKKKEQGVSEDWQKANKKDKTDGMSQKAVNAYKKEHPGSKLKTAVTTKPSKLKKGSKASKRRTSYCARSKGQMDMHNISCAKTPDKAICKSRRRWNCESIENLDAMLAEAVKKRDELEQGQYYIWTVYFDDGTDKRVKVTSDQFDAKAYYAKKNKVVVNVDYDWTIHNERK